MTYGPNTTRGKPWYDRPRKKGTRRKERDLKLISKALQTEQDSKVIAVDSLTAMRETILARGRRTGRLRTALNVGIQAAASELMMMEMDYSQVEARVLASLVDDMQCYILDGDGTPVRAGLRTWAEWVANNETTRRIAYTEINEGVIKVSTVFVGSPGCLYETMVFVDGHSTEQCRSITKEDALRIHGETVIEMREQYDAQRLSEEIVRLHEKSKQIDFSKVKRRIRIRTKSKAAD